MNNSVQSIAVFTTNSWVSPLAVLRILGPAQSNGIKVLAIRRGGQPLEELISRADVIIIQRDFPRRTEEYGRIVSLARQKGKPVIVDFDDLIFELPDYHPDSASQYYSQAMIPMIRAVVEADLITASTPPIMEYLRQFNPNVYLLPNYLNDEIWRLRSPELNRDNYPVVIGYMGGDSHLPDIEALQPALLKILSRYQDKVLFRFLGGKPPPALLKSPNVMWLPSRTYDYARFAADFLQQRYDIFIAPLRNNLFNRSKSPIKFLEYSATGTPGVYSNLETYASIVNHGENGFLASSLEEWEKYITLLIESPNLRYETAHNAQETVRQHWLLSQHDNEWVDTWNDALSIEITPFNERQPVADIILKLSEDQQEWIHYQSIGIDITIHRLTEELDRQQKQTREKEQTIQELQYELSNIYTSNTWKLTQKLAHLRFKVAPSGSNRARLLSFVLGKALSFKRKRGDRNESANSGTPPPSGSAAIARDVIRIPDSSTSNEPRGVFPVDTLETADTVKQKKSQSFDIVILPIIDWDVRFQRPQQLAARFSKEGYRVFYLKTTFRHEDSPHVKPIADNLYEVELPSPVPINVYTDTLDKQTTSQLVEAFKVLRGEHDINNAAILVNLPFWTPLALQLREELNWKIVYDCMDYHPGFSTNSEEMLELEDNLSRKSDLIVVTSHRLYDEKSVQNPHCYRIPNGADFDHFRSRNGEEKSVQQPNSKPIIGYYGAIADWFDTDLIRSLATAKPEWEFLLIGDTLYADLSPLAGLDNVQLTGEIPYDSLPRYLHKFNVAIIPFKRIPLTQATNPVKLFEYLSAGKAVVATDLDELRYYAEYARLASDINEWLKAIETAMQDYSFARIQERINFAKNNTWDVRLKDFLEKISALYA